jgi:hypothetical protein
MQVLLGRKLLLPLKESFIFDFRDHPSDPKDARHTSQLTVGHHH